MEFGDILQIAGGGGGGLLAAFVIYTKLVVRRLDGLAEKLDQLNGSVRAHEVQIAVLKTRLGGGR